MSPRGAGSQAGGQEQRSYSRSRILSVWCYFEGEPEYSAGEGIYVGGGYGGFQKSCGQKQCCTGYQRGACEVAETRELHSPPFFFCYF